MAQAGSSGGQRWGAKWLDCGYNGRAQGFTRGAGSGAWGRAEPRPLQKLRGGRRAARVRLWGSLQPAPSPQPSPLQSGPLLPWDPMAPKLLSTFLREFNHLSTQTEQVGLLRTSEIDAKREGEQGTEGEAQVWAGPPGCPLRATLPVSCFRICSRPKIQTEFPG